MRISLYVHLWQAILMFLAGLIAAVGSFVGFLRTGGGEQVLQQALVSFLRTGSAVRPSSTIWNSTSRTRN